MSELKSLKYNSYNSERITLEEVVKNISKDADIESVIVTTRSPRDFNNFNAIIFYRDFEKVLTSKRNQFDQDIENKIGVAIHKIETELRSAIEKFPKPFNSSHEGYAVLKEEVDELWDEIKDNKREGTIERQIDEAIQVGAMAAKYIMQIK